MSEFGGGISAESAFLRKTTTSFTYDDRGSVIYTNAAGKLVAIDATGQDINLSDGIGNFAVLGGKADGQVLIGSTNTIGGLDLQGRSNNAGTVKIRDTTTSGSPTTGALVVEGGAGIGGNLNVGSNLTVGSNLSVGTDLIVTGTITSSTAPTSNNHITNKLYVDTALSSKVDTASGLGLSIAGSTITIDPTQFTAIGSGNVIINGGPPTAPNHIANKAYVDSITQVSTNFGTSPTGAIIIGNSTYDTTINRLFATDIYASGTINVHNNNITNLPPIPGGDNHAVCKSYADAIAAGFGPKNSCRLKTTDTDVTNLLASAKTGSKATKIITNAPAFGSLEIDSTPVEVGDRILFANTATGTASEHYGIYVVTDKGSPTTSWILMRSADANDDPIAGELSTGTFTFVTKSLQGWSLTQYAGGVMDTDEQFWSQVTQIGSGSINHSDINFPDANDDHNQYVRKDGRASGQIIIGGTGLNDTLTLRGNTGDLDLGSVLVSNTKDSTTPLTGALQVAGGVGITKNLFVGSDISVTGAIKTSTGVLSLEPATNIDVNNKRIINLANPTDPDDATNKLYVDTRVGTSVADGRVPFFSSNNLINEAAMNYDALTHTLNATNVASTGAVTVGTDLTVAGNLVVDEITSATNLSLAPVGNLVLEPTNNLSLVPTGNLVLDPTGNIDASAKKITNIGTPTVSTDAATKGYVDANSSTTEVLTITNPTTAITNSGSTYISNNFIQSAILTLSNPSLSTIKKISLSRNSFTVMVQTATDRYHVTSENPYLELIYTTKWEKISTGFTNDENILVTANGTAFTGTNSSIAISADETTLAIGYPDYDVTGAVFVFTRINNQWKQQSNAIIGTLAIGNAKQGTSVALSSNGNTLAVGGPDDDSNKGAAWIFTRSAGNWNQNAKIISGTDPTTPLANEQRGFSVSLSADGLTIAVGAPNTATAIGFTSIYIFTTSWTFQQRLIGSGNGGNSRQGYSVALSASGNTVAVGGPASTTSVGSTWIFTRSGATWIQEAQLIGAGSLGVGARQGGSVAISSDGNTVAVGGFNDNGSTPGNGVGATWVFTKTGVSWSPGTKLIGTASATLQRQGSSVSLSSDGNTLAIGAYGDSTNFGATWIFTRDMATWSQQTKLVGTSSFGTPRQGSAVALTSSGDSLVVQGMNVANSWVFNRIITSWSQQGSKLVGSGVAGISGSSQGFSIALSKDGSTMAVGGPTDNNNIGAVWVYTKTGSTWSQQGAKLVGTAAVGTSQQGTSVAISYDGSTLAVGGIGDNSITGATWIFTRSGSLWTQQGAKLVGTVAATAQSQGTSVALSSDGNTLAVGGMNDNATVGATWIFTRSGSTWSQQGTKLVGTGSAGSPKQGSAVALSSDGNTLAVGGMANSSDIGATWIFTRTGSTWTQQGLRLLGAGGSGNSLQGRSVSLSNDGNTLAVGGPGDAGIGATWIFTRSGTTWSPQGSKLVGTVSTTGQNQGFSISLTGDGNTLAIGGPGNNSTVAGNTWIFTRTGTTWTQLISLVGSDTIGNHSQGYSVSISNNLSLAVGGRTDNTNIGAAWVFNKPFGNYNFDSTVEPSIAIGKTSIESIAVSGDGNYIAVGLPTFNSSNGCVLIYLKTNTGWQLQTTTPLVGLLSTASRHGSSVAISYDGSTLVVGGSNDGSGVGAAWIFTRTGSTWTQQGPKILPINNNGSANFGIAASISADGNTVAIGGRLDNSSTGATWIYTRTDTTWSQQAKLVGTGSVGAIQQGFAISLSENGNTLVVGGPADTVSKGAIWIFNRFGSAWSQYGSKITTTTTSANAQFGYAVSISGDGKTIAVGAPSDKTPTIGCVVVYNLVNNNWVQKNKKYYIYDNFAVSNGIDVKLNSNGSIMVVGASGYQEGQGAAIVYSADNEGIFTLQKILCGPLSDTINVGQGRYVAISGNSSVIVSAAPNAASTFDNRNLWTFT